MAETPPPAPTKTCPLCGKPTSPRHQPFCSQRCATIDLARWITGNYRVPADDAADEEPSPSDDEEAG